MQRRQSPSTMTSRWETPQTRPRTARSQRRRSSVSRSSRPLPLLVNGCRILFGLSLAPFPSSPRHGEKSASNLHSFFLTFPQISRHTLYFSQSLPRPTKPVSLSVLFDLSVPSARDLRPPSLLEPSPAHTPKVRIMAGRRKLCGSRDNNRN